MAFAILVQIQENGILLYNNWSNVNQSEIDNRNGKRSYSIRKRVYIQLIVKHFNPYY